MGHGRLAGNSLEIDRAGQKKVTKSISRERMVAETWLIPQNDCKIGFSEGMQANYTHATTGSAPKMNYSHIWGPYMVKF